MTSLTRGRYEQLEVVGAGGQGRIVKALDHLHDRLVALKVRALHSEADRQALLSEAGILFRLPPSPYLPVVREDFFDGDDYVIVMDWVEGTDLARILHAEGRPGLPPTLVLGWLADAAAALTHLHTHDPPVIHGDVKPANLILTKGGRVALVDFGASSTSVAPGRRGGTPGYAAPERATRGDSTRASDVYSLAATAFALLTGDAPTGVRPSWDGIDPALADQLETAIRAGLATDPARRPATPGDLVERLRAGWAGSLPTGVLTFCFTDIVGSTGLWEAEPAAMSHALVLHDKTIATAVERCGGRLIDAMGEGDSTVSVFDSPIAAVAAAIDVHRDLAEVTWPAGLTIHDRIGLHTGEAEFRDGSYYGVTLNTAARVRGLADGGQIVASEDTAALVRDHLPHGASLVDLGPARLRGRSVRMQVFAVAASGVDAPPPGTDCPYPGLLSFAVDDADRYYGRDAVVHDLSARLQAHRFVTVVGASGSGKSSLLQAGVGSRWSGGADVITPGSTPVLPEELCGPTDRLLIVDQFEELFTLVESVPVRDAFVDALLAVERPVAVGLRADFYGPCAAYPELAVRMANQQVLLGPMVRDELRAAIEQPARSAGLRLEPGLVELLLSEVEGEPGELPLLAHALRATWEERDGRTLTIEAYRSAGGVKGAIAGSADQVLASFDEADREVAQQLLLRLVEPGIGVDDTRRRATLGELRPAGDTTGRADHVVDVLAGARLVSVDAGTVQVAHEALIREWPQLREWLADQRGDLHVQRQVTTAAEAWSAGGREPSELYRGPRLATAVDWLERHPHASELEADFLGESAAEAERVQHAQARANRRLRASLAGVAVALVLAILGATFAVRQSRDASTSRDHADVARVAAVSRSLTERQPDVGLLLGVEAYRREASAETRSTLLAGIEAHPLLLGLLHGTDAGFAASAFTPDGTTLATATSDGSGTLLWDTATRRRVGVLRDGRRIVLDTTISPDGRTLVSVTVSADATSHLQVWDLGTRRLVHDIESPAGLLSTADFSADGKTVITQGGAFTDRPSRLIAVLWDATTWRPRGEPWTLSDEYTDDSVTVPSADGAVLAVPRGDGADVLDVAGRATRRHISVADGEMTAAALSSDGRLAVLGIDTGIVRGVDTTSGKVRFEAFVGDDTTPTAIALSDDDRVLAVGDGLGRTHLVDVESGAALGPPLAANSSSIISVAFSDDGTLLATTGHDRTGAIWRLDGTRAAARRWNDHGSTVTHVTVTPDGRTLVTAGGDAKVVARDLRTGTKRVVRRAAEVLAFDMDAEGRRVVSGDLEGNLIVATLPGLVRAKAGHFMGDGIYAAAFNPSSGVVAVSVPVGQPEGTGGPDDVEGYVALWDPDTGKEVAPRILMRGGFAVALDWSPDGTTLAASSDNNVLRLYRAGPTVRQLGRDIASEDDTITAVAFSPDGRTVAAGTSSGIVRRYDVAGHRQVGPDLPGLAFEVGGVAYSPDGTRLAATTVGLGTTRLWDASTGTPIGGELVAGRTPFTQRTMPIDHRYPSRPAFDPHGDTLFTPGVDGSVMAWDLRPSAWARAACEIVGRDLDEAEWRQYVGDDRYRKTCPSG